MGGFIPLAGAAMRAHRYWSFLLIFFIPLLTGYAQDNQNRDEAGEAALVGGAAIVAADQAQEQATARDTDGKAEAVAKAKAAAPETVKVVTEREKTYPVEIGGEVYRLPFTTLELGVSFVILLLGALLRTYIARWIFGLFRRLAKRTKWEFDDAVVEAVEIPASWFIVVFALYLSIWNLGFEQVLGKPLGMYFSAATIALVSWALFRMVDAVGDLLLSIARRGGSGFEGFIPLFKKIARVFVVVIGVLTVIDSLGIPVTPLLATFGLGGAAIALASRDTVANLFGSLMIVLDRPFKVGDWIMIGDKVDGDVEEIGLRSTKVRTWPKTIISIPNSVLANEYINNWSRMPKRRVKQVIGLTYETSADQMNGLVQDIRGILKTDEGVQQDFILVNFTDFGSSSLDILVYYFTTTTSWIPYMEVRQRVNEKIMRAVEARGLSFAFPSRTLYFGGDVARHWAGMPQEPDNENDSPADTGPGGGGNRNRRGQRHGDAGGEGRLPGDHGPQMPY